MNEAVVRDGLLVVALVFSALLMLVSGAMCGRKLAEIEYQREAGINGVQRIEAWINLRTHVNRVVLGTSFMIPTFLSLGDLLPATRMWISWGVLIGMLMLYVISSILDWLDERRQVKLLMRARQQTLSDPVEMIEPNPGKGVS